MAFLEKIIVIYSIIIFIYFLIVNLTYVGLIGVSLRRLREFVRLVNTDNTATSDYTKPISILVPAYNEQETIIDNITSLLDLKYPAYEVIVVNDGSKDETLSRIINHFNLRKIDIEYNLQIECNKIRRVYSSFELPQLVVVDKENGGKSDALNAGINVSRYPLYCAIDADCVIEKDALLRIVKPFLKYKDTIAVGGFIRLANGCKIKEGKVIETKLPKKLIERFQIIEYFRAFLTSRVGWEVFNGLLIISGAFGLFKKSAVIEVGGYQKTIGEDMELTLRMHEYYRKNKLPYKIDFASDAVCWTQAPDNLKGLGTQRTRWQMGLIDSLLKHKGMLLNPKYGVVGILSMPYFWFVEMLGPIIELIGYIIMLITILMGTLTHYFIYIFLVAYLFGMLFSLSAILMEQISYKRYRSAKEVFSLVFIAFIDQFIYRQMTVWWRIKGFWKYKNNTHSWGTIQRKSFAEGIK